MDFKPGDRVRPNKVFTDVCGTRAYGPGIVLTPEDWAAAVGMPPIPGRIPTQHDGQYLVWLPKHIEHCTQQTTEAPDERRACTCDLQSLLRSGCTCGGV
jgi:hypothetical protein